MRLTGRSVVMFAVASFAVACEAATRTTAMTEPHIQPLALLTPETSYRLSADERAKVVPGFDVEALERLLRRIRPDMRQEVLQQFQLPQPGEPIPLGIMEFTEPELNPLLDEVWATMWDDAADEFLAEGASSMPGRSLARQRREERRKLVEGRNQNE